MFDGREPAQTTEYEYEGGLLVRSVTIREPAWTEADRAEILALGVHRGSICPCGCGQPVDETLKPEADGPAFIATQSTCQARMALLEAQRGAAEERGTENAAARLWRIDIRKR